jgi:flagellar biosynthesis protein FlhF
LLNQSKPAAKPAIPKPLEELAENLRKQSQLESSSALTTAPEPSAAPTMESSEIARLADSTSHKPHRKPRWHYRPSPEVQRELLSQPKETLALPRKLVEAKNLLLNQGVDPVVVEKAIKCCHESLSPQSLARDDILQDVLKKQLEAKIHVFTESALKAHHHIVIIGPSGAGKTSFTGKLAAHIKLKRAEKVMWVSADTVRTGAIAETRVFTELLDIPIALVYEPEELPR